MCPLQKTKNLQAKLIQRALRNPILFRIRRRRRPECTRDRCLVPAARPAPPARPLPVPHVPGPPRAPPPALLPAPVPRACRTSRTSPPIEQPHSKPSRSTRSSRVFSLRRCCPTSSPNPRLQPLSCSRSRLSQLRFRRQSSCPQCTQRLCLRRSRLYPPTGSSSATWPRRRTRPHRLQKTRLLLRQQLQNRAMSLRQYRVLTCLPLGIS